MNKTSFFLSKTSQLRDEARSVNSVTKYKPQGYRLRILRRNLLLTTRPLRRSRRPPGAVKFEVLQWKEVRDKAK